MASVTSRNQTESSLPDRAVRTSVTYETGKRIMDIAVSLAVLVLLSPVWLLIGLLILATSPGGALYRGRVMGLGGREFTYYKFRTMRADSDNSAHREWLEEFVKADQPFTVVDEPDGSRPIYKVVGDPRITPVGHWLRRLSLDEIPQLFNVLRGDMSLVGPRPPVPYEYEHYDDWARQRLAVKPGITGLYQVTERSAVGFRGMVAIDLEYIERRSLSLDLWIILRTPVVMLLGRGAA